MKSRVSLPAIGLWLAAAACASVPPGQSPTMITAPSASPLAASPTPEHPGWLAYQSSSCGFEFLYPPEGALRDDDPLHARIDLPVVPGTNLSEKYALIDVELAQEPCLSWLAEGYDLAQLPTSEVTIGGTVFLRQEGADAGVGNRWNWVSYSTPADCGCLSLSFVLHSTVPENYPTPPPVFDEAAESAVFDEILSTFTWAP
jgi:hypothetical protein